MEYGYYICLLFVFSNLIYSIYSAVVESKGAYRKQKFFTLCTLGLFIFVYAIGYMNKSTIIAKFARDFTLFYCISFMIALLIVVYKEKYRQSIEEELYDEIERAIKDKAVLINRKIVDIEKSDNPKKDLAVIKLLVGYCKRKCNLIVIEKNKNIYTSDELGLCINQTIEDARSIGVSGAVNIINKFDIPIFIASSIYAYIYNLCEYCSRYDNANLLIAIERLKGEIRINTIIDSDSKLQKFENNFEMSQFVNKYKIIQEQSFDENVLRIALKIPVNTIKVREVKINENENRALLKAKSKIHDVLGQRLSVVSSILENDIIYKEKLKEIKPLLKNILDDLDNDAKCLPNEMLNQIIRTCELAGTNLYIVGDLPRDYIKAIALVRIIRECSTNAIRHAKAKNVYVYILENNAIEMEITDDGYCTEDYIEGDGIKGIKNRVEELNGSIEIKTDKSFSIKIKI